MSIALHRIAFDSNIIAKHDDNVLLMMRHKQNKGSLIVIVHFV